VTRPTHPTPVFRAAAALAAALLAAAACAQPNPADLARMAEVERLLEAYAPAVWPGWSAQALLVRHGPVEYLVAHPSPPEGFARLDGVEAGGYPVYVLHGHLTPAPIATSWPVGDAWAVAIPVLDEFQSAIDAALGPGVVTLDDGSYVRALVHETFHAFQMNTYGGPGRLPRADESVDERAVLAALERVPTLDERQRQQGRTLAGALTAPAGPEGDAEAVAAARAFLALREAWRDEAPAGTRALERQVEWVEGLARYADVTLMRRAARDGFPPGPGLPPMPTADAVWTEFLGQLRDPASIPGGLRDRLYVLGAAQGFALDRLAPGWRERALPGGETAEDLLAEAAAR